MSNPYSISPPADRGRPAPKGRGSKCYWPDNVSMNPAIAYRLTDAEGNVSWVRPAAKERTRGPRGRKTAGSATAVGASTDRVKTAHTFLGGNAREAALAAQRARQNS